MVSEPLEKQRAASVSTADGNTEYSGAGSPSMKPQKAIEESLIQQHGCRSVLRNLERASTPQQASPVFALYTGQHSSASSATTCMQAIHLPAFEARFLSSRSEAFTTQEQ